MQDKEAILNQKIIVKMTVRGALEAALLMGRTYSCNDSDYDVLISKLEGFGDVDEAFRLLTMETFNYEKGQPATEDAFLSIPKSDAEKELDNLQKQLDNLQQQIDAIKAKQEK